MSFHQRRLAPRQIKRRLGVGTALAAWALSCTAQAAPSAQTVQQRLSAAVALPVADHAAPGTMLLVQSGGRTLFDEAAGSAGPPPAPKLRTDMILWIASMTKPMTATAILMLAEAGKLQVTDPVSRYIPEFAAVKVNMGGILVPATRAITLQDLLTHTSGIASGFPPPPPGHAGSGGPPPGPGGPPPPPPGSLTAPPVTTIDTLASWVPKLAKLPLERQPGTRWEYSPGSGFDVLARVVEIVSGQGFRQYMTAHIFVPLGMTHTGFGMAGVPPAQLMPVPPRFVDDPRVQGAVYTSGAAGGFSTLGDYAKFATMLANDGMVGDTRILTPASVKAMSGNHVGTLFHNILGRSRADGEGFGYGVAIILDPAAAGVDVPAGSFGWDGAGGSRFWVSPGQHRVIVEYGPPKAQASMETAVNAAFPAK